jgi:LacI family transcriptional regulator
MLLNRSVHDEIIRCRLQKAIGLLSESDLAIAQIAEDTGFKYQQYMSEVFKKYLGESPATLRNRAKVKKRGHGQYARQNLCRKPPISEFVT